MTHNGNAQNVMEPTQENRPVSILLINSFSCIKYMPSVAEAEALITPIAHFPDTFIFIKIPIKQTAEIRTVGLV